LGVDLATLGLGEFAASAEGEELLAQLAQKFGQEPLVDPGTLRLPPTRPDGADPFKLADQIRKYENSTDGMPPIQVTRGANGEMMINDGVTRATRANMTPGTKVHVEIIEDDPSLNLQNLPTVGKRTLGTQ
jgi:hypothetical protein